MGIIELVPNKSKLIIREQIWIDFFKPEYNIRKIAKSNFGLKFSNETKAKMRASSIGHRRGIKISDETKKLMSLSSIGRKRSYHTREKMRMSHLGKKKPWAIGVAAKNALTRKGKTWEEIYGVDRANERRENHRQRKLQRCQQR